MQLLDFELTTGMLIMKNEMIGKLILKATGLYKFLALTNKDATWALIRD